MAMAVDQPQLDLLISQNPHIGLQTYEFFEGDSDARASAKQAFLNGAENPQVDYPKLDPIVIGEKEKSLSQLFDVSQGAVGLSGEALEAYNGTIGYRLREARMLLQACDLNQPDLEFETFSERAVAYQTSNESLYGVVDDNIFSGVVAELKQMVDGTDYKGQAAEICDELDDIFFGPYLNEAVDALPTLSSDAKSYLVELIDWHFKPERESVQRQRQIIDAEGREAFEPDDLVALIQDTIARRGLQRQIKAFKAPGTLVSWSQDDEGVRVGDRRDPIESDDEAFGINVHEEGWHGQKYVNGRASDIIVFGNGLYTEADPGEQPDYLTFEEGNAAVFQNLASKNTEPWSVTNLRSTFTTALAYFGKDFRRVFDVSWRLRALIDTVDGHVDEASVAKAQGLAYDDALRLFRGTPMHLTPELPFPVTYNKDLAYLKGKISAVNFWNDHYGDDNIFYFLLSGKFDPTNKRQLAIAHAATRGIYA